MIEAIDGQNVTISFDIDEVEKADEVRITFKEDKKKYDVLLAQEPWVYDDPPPAGVKLIVEEDRLSVIIQDVNISRSGLYKVEVYTGTKVSEDDATLVVIGKCIICLLYLGLPVIYNKKNMYMVVVVLLKF